MSYQVLARKWRPQLFSDVVGQVHVLTALANALTSGRLHHAYLFSGTRGVGKTTIARLLAKGLNCETGITATPCRKCDNCREIEQGRFVDLIEIDAASRTKVEDTRALLDNVQYAPARGRFKVYLIDEVHMLSRHSFNALLKTLEEPPEHVKFLLATTDPQKLPVTILSRCLQFHLRALDSEQIRGQLEHILHEEAINSQPRALQLLARAANGSMRDALSLTDQAIALGQGEVTADGVSLMLGSLDDDQPMALIEALAEADGGRVMALLQQAASRGVDWENLLIEMLRLLHRVAMMQLLADIPVEEDSLLVPRLRELARVLPPAEVQLFYQTLLTGRKELPLAPDYRMGVEMTMLRALAFHPQANVAPPPAKSSAPMSLSTADSSVSSAVPPSEGVMTSPQPTLTKEAEALPDATSQLLKARKQLMRQQETNRPKKPEPAAKETLSAGAVLQRLAQVTECRQKPKLRPQEQQPKAKKEPYRWKAQTTAPLAPSVAVATPAKLRCALEYEKTPELAEKLAQEAQRRDPWAAEIATMSIPKLVQQLALNAWKEVSGTHVCLHLRTSHSHLNTPAARQALQQALSLVSGGELELSIIADDNSGQLTPLEWRQKIYEEKLAQARQSIMTDTHIQKLCHFFDAELDEESIRPV